MHSTKNVLAFVMAGGEGSRLHPLTTDRCKPAVPFNGKHRVVDFVLSNLINSDIFSIYLLVQYKSQSLIEHVRTAWTMPRFGPDHFVTVVPPQMRNGPEWFQGTADAVYQNLHLIESFRPDIVAVFGADHIYRMDVRQMIEFHQQSGADVSVATLPVRLEQCDQFGVVEVDAQHRITDFKEKPKTTAPMPGSSTHALASMGNYIFNADVLIEALKRGMPPARAISASTSCRRWWRATASSPTTSTPTSFPAPRPTKSTAIGGTSAPSTPTSTPTSTRWASRPSSG